MYCRRLALVSASASASLLLLLASGGLSAEKPDSNPKVPAKKAGQAKARPKVEVEPGKERVYKTSAGVERKMEIYFPADWDPKARKVPGVILFHGGGWTGGNLNQFRYACKYLASRGLVAATAEYRMLKKPEIPGLPAGESHKRVCITDAKSAIRWMKQHAGELGIDPNRIITGGGSAGGHVSLLATNNPGLNDPADPKEFDTRVVAYLLFNPALGKDAVADAEVDLVPHLKAELPPALFLFGSNDTDWKKGTDVARGKLKELGNTTNELWIAQGQGHGFFNSPPWQDVTLTLADQFLVKHGLLQGEATLPAPKNGEKMEKAP